MHSLMQVKEAHRQLPLHFDLFQICFEENKADLDRICLENELTIQDVQLLLLDQTSSSQNADFLKKWHWKCLNHLFCAKSLCEDTHQTLSLLSDLLKKDHRKFLIFSKKSPRIIQCC